MSRGRGQRHASRGGAGRGRPTGRAPPRGLPTSGPGLEGIVAPSSLPEAPHRAASSSLSPEEFARAVGMLSFVGRSASCSAWSGTIKSSVHDFHVREISLSTDSPDGEPVVLTELAPEDAGMGEGASRSNWTSFEWSDFTDPSSRDKALDELATFLTPGSRARLEGFLRTPCAERDAEGFRSVMVCDKEGRRRAHDVVREGLMCLDSNVKTVPAQEAREMGLDVPDVSVDDQGLVRVFHADLRTTSLVTARRWDKAGPQYVRFVMEKVGLDGSSALAKLMAATRRPAKTFSFAGMKDRWAVTIQAGTAYHTFPDELARVNAKEDLIRVGNCSMTDTELVMGRLWGNEFGIVVRDLAVPEDTLAELSRADLEAELSGLGVPLPKGEAHLPHLRAAVVAARCIRDWGENGFLFANYFGSQRFGTGGVSTHEVGIDVLRGHFHAAACDVLGIPLDGPDRDAQGRSVLQQLRFRMVSDECRGSAERVLGLRRVAPPEAAVLSALATFHPNNAAAIVAAVPRSIRLMYLHAVQSWIWNHAVSKRLETLGASPVPGDLVIDASRLESAGLGDARFRDESHLDDESLDGRRAAREEIVEAGIPPVRVVTEEDVRAGAVSICDVVMPLPGTEVQYPTHSCGASLYDSLLASVGITTAGVWGAEGAPMLKIQLGALPGAYRPMMSKAIRCEAGVRWYDPANMRSAILTDSERLRGETLPEAAEAGASHPCAVFKFRLRSSVYATVALRQVMGQEASATSRPPKRSREDAELEASASKCLKKTSGDDSQE
jgi:tRNA(Glu) U13 pseudouridine synthase TruD